MSILDAGHFDAHTAYAAINTLRLDDMRPHIYRTHDGGKTWTEIIERHSRRRHRSTSCARTRSSKGLLFAGTERDVYVSFDDGDHWQSLRLNMPATLDPRSDRQGRRSVVGTHGRGFWILDDITPLRQTARRRSLHRRPSLFKPQTAHARSLEHEHRHAAAARRAGGRESAGRRDHRLLPRRGAAGPVTLEILDARASPSAATPAPIPCSRRPDAPVPPYWVRPPQSLLRRRRACTASSGTSTTRLFPVTGGRDVSDCGHLSAIPRPRRPRPGCPRGYTVKLTVNGKSYTQPLTVKMDPRVKTSPAGLAAAVHAFESDL